MIFLSLGSTGGNGKTWNLRLPTFPKLEDIYYQNDGYFFITSSKYGIYRSDDFGKNWVQANSVYRSDVLSINSNAIGELCAITDGGFLFQATSDSAGLNQNNH